MVGRMIALFLLYVGIAAALRAGVLAYLLRLNIAGWKTARIMS